jgi:hypothetical protein
MEGPVGVPKIIYAARGCNVECIIARVKDLWMILRLYSAVCDAHSIIALFFLCASPKQDDLAPIYTWKINLEINVLQISGPHSGRILLVSPFDF